MGGVMHAAMRLESKGLKPGQLQLIVLIAKP
jgi:hypothetical protein